MIWRFDLKRMLILGFAALGPLGNIPTPHFFPDSFRAYYFLLPFFPCFFFLIPEKIGKIVMFFLPFLIYSSISAFGVEWFKEANEPHTLFRFFLLFSQFFFIAGAASALKNQGELFLILKTYIRFFFVSMGIGYLLFIGYYLGFIPLQAIARFSVLAQFGFGILRFSPGSYPNEYGIVSSFVLSLLVLIFLEGKREAFGFSKKGFLFLSALSFSAFLLTTTRAAYLSFAATILYLTWKSGRFFKIFVSISSFVLLFFIVLNFFHFNMFHILSSGFTQRIDEGSLGERYFMWLDTIERGWNHFFWGTGFASLSNIHNVYLQLCFELGFFGIVFLLAALFLSGIELFFNRQRRVQDESSRFFSKVRKIGLINVCSFAASNHNLNHHLTWFVFFLCLASLLLSSYKGERGLIRVS